MLRRLWRRQATPPSRLWPQQGDFVESSRQDVRFLVRVAGLQPEDRILDVGCGTGRLAVALVDFLRPGGRYEGFDVRPEAVAWATRHVARGDRRFRFTHVNALSPYNPKGIGEVGTLRFPCPDRSFDLVVLLSVFTHLRPEHVRHYLSEIARVLGPEGRCAATFFVLEAPALMEMPHNTLDFAHDLGGWFSVDAEVPERAVAYPEKWIREAYREAGLSVKILPSTWRDPQGPRWQDTAVAHHALRQASR